MAIFIPPSNNSIVSNCTKFFLPAALASENLEVRISSNCMNSLRGLQDKHAVLLFNHSDRLDPLVAFALSKQCKQDFYYLAAREQFDGTCSMRGWLMQQCGAYSVIRGMPEDNQSRDKTVEIIEKGTRKLVMFPEGDISGRDDQILPFKEDGMHNILRAQNNLSTQASVFALPIAFHYKLHPSALPAFNKSIAKLERRLELPASSSRELLPVRIERLLESFVSALEESCTVSMPSPSSIDQRLNSVCRRILKQIQDQAGLKMFEFPSTTTMLYSLRSILCRPNWSTHCLNIVKRNKLKSHLYTRELDHTQQLLILSSTLQQPLTLEVVWRILDRLELLMFGKTTVKGKRTAWVDSGNTINIQDYLPLDESGTSKLSLRGRTNLQNALNGLTAQHRSSVLTYPSDVFCRY